MILFSILAFLSFLQNEFIDYQGPTAYFPQSQCTDQWHSEADKFQHDFQVKLEYLSSQLIEKQNQQWQQLWQKYDQLRDEFQNNFTVLVNHVSNTCESHTSSLKLFFMQEVELLKQDLKMTLEKQGLGQTKLPVPLVEVSQKQPTFPVGHKQVSEGKNMPGNMRLPSENQDESSHVKHQQNQLQKKHTALPEPGLDITFLSEPIFDGKVSDPNGKLQNKDVHFINPVSAGEQLDKTAKAQKKTAPQMTDLFKQKPNLKNKLSAASDMKIADKSDSKAFSNSTSVDSSSSSVSSTGPSSEATIQATGFYADIVSKQMKDVNSSSAWPNLVKGSNNSRGKDEANEYNSTRQTSPGNADYRVDSKTGQKQALIEHIPTDCVSFTITNSDSFSSLREHYLTPYYYTKSEACKVRFRVCFNAASQLNVFFLVSNGKYDNSKVWPISFSGNGFIYNESSKSPSQIWTLGPLTCSKPGPGKEISYQVTVSLKTLRNSHPDVTYQIIYEKGFALNKCLAFDWNLSATEN